MTSHPPAWPVCPNAGGGVQLELLTVCRSDVEPAQTHIGSSLLLSLAGCHSLSPHENRIGIILSHSCRNSPYRQTDIDHENVLQAAPIVDVDAGGAAHGDGL